MIFPGSRYAKPGTYLVTTAAGATVTVTRLPLPQRAPLLGFHRRTEGQRLDLIAARYLSDPTATWRLCDASGAISPDALASHDLVAIPGKDR